MATTAAELAVELQTDMATMQAFVMNLVNTGELEGLLQVCETYGVTAAMLGEIAAWPTAAYSEAIVHAFFAANGLDSSSIATPTPSPAVVDTVSSPTLTEGMSAGFVVNLVAETQGVCTADVSIAANTGHDGHAGLDDLSGYVFSDGVTLEGLTLHIPDGVSSFTITLMTADDTAVEGDETFALTVGGVTGTATIHDNDAPPSNGISLMPEDLEGMLSVVRLNGQDGILSTTNLRADIVAGSNQASYDMLFQTSNYIGAEDGVFTNAEIGWSLGNVDATPEMMESLFFGTMIHALKAVDNAEMAAIGQFAFTHQDELNQGDEAAFNALISLLVDTFVDAAPENDRAFSDGMIHDAIVEVGIDLVAMAQYEPSIFHGLLNWV